MRVFALGADSKHELKKETVPHFFNTLKGSLCRRPHAASAATRAGDDETQLAGKTFHAQQNESDYA